FAALAIQESVNSCKKAGAFKIYNKKLSEITSAIDHAKILRYLIFPKPSEYFFIKALPKAKRLPQKHLDLMADDIKYGEYIRYLVSRILKGITKRLLFIK
ncbi:MAG: hypothetical protein GXP13_08870, partial [Gammaproteobacteria bacterium]|nr:hypothetical protein [Gammaproteobacteria bacterium]